MKFRVVLLSGPSIRLCAAVPWERRCARIPREPSHRDLPLPPVQELHCFQHPHPHQALELVPRCSGLLGWWEDKLNPFLLSRYTADCKSIESLPGKWNVEKFGGRPACIWCLKGVCLLNARDGYTDPKPGISLEAPTLRWIGCCWKAPRSQFLFLHSQIMELMMPSEEDLA